MLRARYSQSPNHIGVSPLQTELQDPGAARRVPEARLSWQDPAIAQVQILPSLTTGPERRVNYDHLAETHPLRSAHHQIPKAMEWSRDRNSALSSDERPRSMEGSVSPRAEREVSDLYIDSITRTPRYGLGRHKTYDEMLLTMSIEDPFNSEYSPSSKQPGSNVNVTLPAKKRRDTSVLKDDYSNTFPLRNENRPEISETMGVAERPLTESPRGNTLKVTQTTLVSDKDTNTAKSVDLFHGDGKRRTLSLSSADDSPRQRKFSVSSDDYPRQRKLSKLSGDSPRAPFLWTEEQGPSYPENSPMEDMEGYPQSGIQTVPQKSSYAVSMDSVNKYEEHLEHSWRSQPLSRTGRELTDTYLDNVTRTPRYGLGRHKTYDEILLTMSRDDPFLDSYTPSGKKPIKHKTTVTKHGSKVTLNKREEDTLSESCPALNEKGHAKPRKTCKKEETEKSQNTPNTQKNVTKTQEHDKVKVDQAGGTDGDSKTTEEQTPQPEVKALKDHSEKQNQQMPSAIHEDRLAESNGRTSSQRDQTESQTDLPNRKPRYGLGRHNTYDDMLATMSQEDPFKGDYSPSGKPRVDKKATPTVRRTNSVQEKLKSSDIKNNSSNVNSRPKDPDPKEVKKDPPAKSEAATAVDNQRDKKSKVVDDKTMSVKTNDTHTPSDSENPEKVTGTKKEGAASNLRSGLRKTTLADRKKDVASGLQKERTNLSLPTTEKPAAKKQVGRHKTSDDILLGKHDEKGADSDAKPDKRSNYEENIRAHLTLLKSKRRDAFGHSLKLSENDELNMTDEKTEIDETNQKKMTENKSARLSFMNKGTTEKKHIVRTNSKQQVNDKNISSPITETKDSQRKTGFQSETDEKKSKGIIQDRKVVNNANVEKKPTTQATSEKKPLAATVHGKQDNVGSVQEKKPVLGSSFKRSVSSNNVTEKKVASKVDNENKTSNKTTSEKSETIPTAKDKNKINLLKKEKSNASESSLKSKSKTEIEKKVLSANNRDKKHIDDKLTEKKVFKPPDQEMRVDSVVSTKGNNSNGVKPLKNVKNDNSSQLKSPQTSKSTPEIEKGVAAGTSIPDKRTASNPKVQPKDLKAAYKDSKNVTTAEIKSKSPAKANIVKNKNVSKKSDKSNNIALTKENILKDLNKKVGSGPKDSDSGSVKSDATYTINEDQKKLSDSRSGKLKRPVVK